MTKRLLIPTLALLLISSAACRSRKTQPPVAAPPPVTQSEPAPVATPVEPPNDFVTAQEPRATDETLDALNQRLRSEGLLRDAFFTFDASTLSDEAQEALRQSATWLKSNSQYTISVEGHCDERGTEQYNLALGDRRANTALEYLVTLGVDSARMRTVSYGESRPFEPGSDESSWAQNRRAHLVVTGKR